MKGFQTIQVLPGLANGPMLADFDEVCTIINADVANTLTIGDYSALQVGDEFTVPFGPGQTLSVDGSTQLYGALPAGSQPITILKLPGATQLSGTSSQIPTSTPPKIATAVATSGNTVDLIGTALNPKKLPIQLLVCSMSSFVAAAAPSAFQVQDAIQDDASMVYVPLQVGLPSSGGICDPTITVPMQGATVPAKRKLQLSNGGGAGALHQCAAMVIYYLVGS